jgi:hypothetical protein
MAFTFPGLGRKPAASPNGKADAALRRDLKTLARFVEVYCRHRHRDADKSPAVLKTHDLYSIVGKVPLLCRPCRELLAHAMVMRSRCPMEPKPACKNCPSHCFHPRHREQMRRVMRFSGKRLMLTGRLDYLWHLLS